MPVVRISDDLFSRLQRHATPLVDSTNDVLERILSAYERGAGVNVVAADTPLFESFTDLWAYVVPEYNKSNPRFPASSATPNQYWKQIPIGFSNAHYEFAVRRRDARFDVCIHFESGNPAENISRLAMIKSLEPTLRAGVGEEFWADVWGLKRRWTQVMLRVPFEGRFPDRTAVARGIELMNLLVERTWPTLEQLRDT